MQLIELTGSDKQQYDDFVAASGSGSFLQCWEWGEWQSALGRQVERLKIKDEHGETAGVIQLVKMPLPFGKFYWYSPYGPVVSGELRVTSHEFLNRLKEKLSDAIFIRIEPKEQSAIKNLQSAIVKSQNIQPGKTLIIDLTKSEEQLLAGMHSKTRYNIKVAQKHSVEIKDEFDISIGHGLFAKEAVELMVQTAQRQGFKGYGSDYYQKMINHLAVQNRGALRLHIYKAIFQNQLLSSAIILDFGNTRTFLFGGSSEFHKNVMAPYLLHWQAMLDAQKNGLKFYDFWGIETSSGETPGFVRFKLGFGGSEKIYAGAYDIVNKQWPYKFYSILRTVQKILR